MSPDHSGDGPVPQDSQEATPTATGPQLARAVLDAALAARGGGARTVARPSSGQRQRGYSGPGPDARDPRALRDLVGDLVAARGWQQPAAQARIFGLWPQVVGPDIAAHCHPVQLEDGELIVEAESTAWATQVRLLAKRLLARIAADVGPDVVRRVIVRGPVAPSWAKGQRRVRGRGPRDTYG